MPSTPPRIAPLAAPYDPEIEELLRAMMPRQTSIEPLKLFRTLAQHRPLAAAMLSLGRFVLGRELSLDLHDRELVIDRGSLVVRRAGREVSLTPTELRLLLVLSGSPRQVFSREQLLDLVWEHDYLGDSRLVDACVQRLRAKIETDTAEPRYIQTVRGFGYRFGPV